MFVFVTRFIGKVGKALRPLVALVRSSGTLTGVRQFQIPTAYQQGPHDLK